MFFNKQWQDKAKSISLRNEVVSLKPLRFFKDTYNGQTIENYPYQILRNSDMVLVGYCDLRVGDAKALFYLGNIGYNIFSHHQGHGYAQEATHLLIDLAKHLDLKILSITCNPDNLASIKTIERNGFIQVDSVAVPADEPLFHQGDYYKNIYELVLKET